MTPVLSQPSNFGRFTLVPTDISWSAVRQRLYLAAWPSRTPSALVGSIQVSAVKGGKLLPSQLVYQLVKLLQEFNFLICSDFQNFVFQTLGGEWRMCKRTSQSILHVLPVAGLSYVLNLLTLKQR